MPTRFRLQLDAQLKDNISGQTAAVRSKRQSGEWAPYAQFVENLGKEMSTPGEEAHHHTTGMSGEAGELLDITKKTWIYGKPLDIEHIIEEMGDLRWYYQSMLNMLGLTDEDIQAANTVKLQKRYPSGVYSNEQAIARADKAPAPAPRKFMGMPQNLTTQEAISRITELVKQNREVAYADLKNDEEGLNEAAELGISQGLEALKREQELNSKPCDEHLMKEMQKFTEGSK